METANDNLFPELENLGAATGFIDEIFEIMEHIPLFGEFDLAEVEQLSAYMECFGAPSGVTLLEEGKEGDYLLLILTGSVDVYKAMPGQGTKLMATVGPGAILGEMSLVDGQKRNASCVSREPTDFAVLRRGPLNVLLGRNPALGARFLLVLLTELTRRLREANQRLLPFIAPATV
ncbi:MAG: cyclic nucleotide-binding domain-containing protein [Rhodocyclales bacterium]|jgi:CRP-like cAMP-binding protein|nr:cyclic nucleotide-binding domain-containing protein [Rhodocyclales bacterium]